MPPFYEISDSFRLRNVYSITAFTSPTSEPVRFTIDRLCVGRNHLVFRVGKRYQLGLARQAGSVTSQGSASTPQGTCESDMKATVSVTFPRYGVRRSHPWVVGQRLVSRRPLGRVTRKPRRWAAVSFERMVGHSENGRDGGLARTICRSAFEQSG